MSYSVSNNSITLTRGDTFKALITIKNDDGTPYTAQPGDSIRFAMGRNYSETEPLIIKPIDPTDLMLKLEPADTSGLDYGSYVYDVELTRANGDVDTFITKGVIKITEEVH